MRDTSSPPASWYDPPTECPESCTCAESHANHDFAQNFHDINFSCCRKEIQNRIDEGTWCAKEPQEHGDVYMSFKKCLECEFEESEKNHGG